MKHKAMEMTSEQEDYRTIARALLERVSHRACRQAEIYKAEPTKKEYLHMIMILLRVPYPETCQKTVEKELDRIISEGIIHVGKEDDNGDR